MIFRIKYYTFRILLYIFVLPKKGSGAEIGVRKGINAKLLYYFARPKFLQLVDNYRIDKYETTSDYSAKEIESMKMKVLRWTLKKGNVSLSLKPSHIFASSHSRGYDYDWIYIDGDHEDLYNDLLNWFTLVKKGGIIMGDDYCDTYPKIKSDLAEFCSKYNFKFKTLHVQWWIQK